MHISCTMIIDYIVKCWIVTEYLNAAKMFYKEVWHFTKINISWFKKLVTFFIF